jgi:hypothetical protein
MENSLNQLIVNDYLVHNLLKIKNQENHEIMNSQIMGDLQKISKYVKNELPAHSKEKELVVESTATHNTHSTHKIEVYDKSLVSNIINVYLDKENRTVLSCLKKPMTIQEIVKSCKTPISSTYRRISFLLEKGYLRVAGYKKELGKKSKSTKFEKTIRNITIQMEEDAVSVTLNINESIIKESKICFVIKE